jgi:hypothetical protein
VSPDGISPSNLIVIGYAKCIVDACEYIDEPCEDSQDFIRPKNAHGMGFSSGERVCYSKLLVTFWYNAAHWTVQVEVLFTKASHLDCQEGYQRSVIICKV